MTPSQTITDILSSPGSQEEKVVKLMELMREEVGDTWAKALYANKKGGDEYWTIKADHFKQYDK